MRRGRIFSQRKQSMSSRSVGTSHTSVSGAHIAVSKQIFRGFSPSCISLIFRCQTPQILLKDHSHTSKQNSPFIQGSESTESRSSFKNSYGESSLQNLPLGQIEDFAGYF